MRLGDIRKIKFGLIFCFIFWDFVPVPLSVIDLRQMVLSLICKFPSSTLLHWLNNCDLILLLRRISLKVVNAMVSKVIFKIKFISIAINLHLAPTMEIWKSFMVCLKFNAVRFDIVFKGPQNNRTKTLLDITASQVPACPNRIISYIMLIYFPD